MQGPVELTVKNIQKTPELEALVERKISKLETLCDYMISCRVTIERPQTYPDRGNPHRVRIDIKVPPGHEIVARQSASQGDMHDPLETVVIKTFQAAERQLKKLVEQQHGKVKYHPHQQVMGIVHTLFPEAGYGFLKTVETQDEVYFHRNSVLRGEFDRLTVGSGVRFAVETGEKGLQASSVERMDTTRSQSQT